MNTITGMCRALSGAWIYRRLFEGVNMDKGTHVFVLIDRECEEYFVKYLPAYRAKYHSEKIIYIKEGNEEKAAESGVDIGADIINIKRNNLLNLMYYVVLFSRDKNIRFLSYEKPFGRNGKALIGVKGIREEDVFSIGIMGIN